MSKKIVKVMVFYEDGTFSEIVDKQTTDIPWPTIPVVTAPCAKCGSATGPCYRSDCPTGWGNPWNNRDKVVD